MPRYIDADALVAELQKKPIHDGHFIHTRDVSDAIFYAPTISPDEVRGVGRWVRISGFHLDHEYHPARYQCDQCKHFVDSGDDRNYCPNCGARMKGAEENHTMDEFMYGQEMGSHSDGSL